MIADFEDFCTWMYVMVDDAWKELAPLAKRSGPKPSTWSDSELIAVALISACRGWEKETRLLTEWEPYRHLFPKFPSRTRYNRRRRNLAPLINQIRISIARQLDMAFDHQLIIDSMPVPVLGFHLAPQRGGDWDAHEASYGWCASKKLHYYGYRFHILITLGGLILDYTLTSADADERPVAEDMLPKLPNRLCLADKGYVSKPLADRLKSHANVTLIALRRRNQHSQLPKPLKMVISRVRQMIETVNNQLVDQFSIQDNLAHTFNGLCARLHTKLAAHTLCIALNHKLDNPNRLQIAELAFTKY